MLQIKDLGDAKGAAERIAERKMFGLKDVTRQFA
jgi:hypothetical protein